MKRIVLVGAGGIGHPALLALGYERRLHGRFSVTVIDDDRVDVTNLHRQILFSPSDVGRPKLEALATRLAESAPTLDVEFDVGRVLPHTAREKLSQADVVIDATDNFATRFLLADACFLAGVPVVHAASIRWDATVLTVSSRGGPCYRCLFEDLPEGDAPDCATAGVMGPVCGVSGAVAAERALAIVEGELDGFGTLTSYDGLRDRLRTLRVRRRADCELCGERPTLRDLDPSRYVPPACAADAL